MLGKTSKRPKPLFAQNIVSKRKAMGWNAHELAERAGIPYPTLRDIEAGINFGREDTRVAIAQALGATMAELYEGERMVPNFAQTAEFLSKLSTLSPVRRGFVLAIVYSDASYLDDTSPVLSQAFETLAEAP